MAVGVTLCTLPFLELLHPPFLPSWNGESGMGNWKWELHSDGVIEGWLYSSDIAT